LALAGFSGASVILFSDCWITDRNIFFIAGHAGLPEGHDFQMKSLKISVTFIL
jgi:hypothetical protein